MLPALTPLYDGSQHIINPWVNPHVRGVAFFGLESNQKRETFFKGLILLRINQYFYVLLTLFNKRAYPIFNKFVQSDGS